MTSTVLAKSYNETNAFARQKGLGYGVRHIVNADALRGARPTELHVLPSFYERRDIHAINAALKRVVRRTPKMVRIEYEKLPSGTYVAIDPQNSLEDVEPEVNPKPRAQDATQAAEDTSKDAVPGQTSLAEFLGTPNRVLSEQLEGDLADNVAVEADLNPQADPDVLDFLDD